MSKKAEIVLEWADGEYLFALKNAHIEELQTICKAGFGEIVQRVLLGRWFYKDISETIRLGFIGGGMGAIEAKNKRDFYMKVAPLADPNNPNSPEAVAKAILQAVTFGIEDLDLPPGEKEAGTNVDS